MNLLKRKSFLVFIISYFIIITGIMFITIKSISEFNNLFLLTDSLNPNYLYTYNSNVKSHYKNYDGKDIRYKWDYIEIEDDYYNVLFTTIDGIENGLPYFNGSYMFFIKYDSLVEVNKYIKIDNYGVENYFIKYDLAIDYIYIYDDSNLIDKKFDIVVYDYISPGIKNVYSSDLVCYSGDYCKKLIIDSLEIFIKFLIAISCISVIINLVAIYFLLNYFIEEEKDIVLINYIYYVPKKKIISKYMLSIGLSLLFINIFMNIVLYFIFNINNFIYSFIIGLIYSVIELIFINIIINTKMKRYLRYNEWRYYNDSY